MKLSGSGKTLPPGINIQPFYDQSIIVNESIKSVRDAILLGLFWHRSFLLSSSSGWGTSLVAALVIPVTVLSTFIALKIMGQTFNLMTLGGLAAAVGLSIDTRLLWLKTSSSTVILGKAGSARFKAP